VSQGSGYDGLTPLHVAAFKGYAEVVELLLAHKGVTVNRAGGGGYTALRVCDAAQEAHVEVVKLLLAHKTWM